MRSEAYFDIVWRQFQKNRPAYWSLWGLVLLFLLAIFAPALASNQPFVFYDGEKGILLSAAAGELKLQDRDGVERVYPVAADVRVLIEGRAGQLERLAAGAAVKVAQNENREAGAITTVDELAASDGTWIYPWFHAVFNSEEKVDFAFNMALLIFFPWVALALFTNRRSKRKDVPGRRRLALVLVEFAALLILACVVCGFFGLRPNNRYATRSFPAEAFDSGGAHYGFYPPAPVGPTESALDARFQPPGHRRDPSVWSESNDGFLHVLGTDDGSRDVLVRLLYGTRISMTVGLVAVGIYVTIGVVVGALAGFYGGAVDMLISRIIEIVLLFPSFFLVLTLVGLLGPSLYVIMFVIGITGWPTIARLTRGEVLKQRSLDYTTAARALGASNLRIIFRHILPNALAPALVAAPFGVAGAIIVEAGLSLLGFGVQPPAPTWGNLLKLGSGNYHYSWLVIYPSLAIFITVTVFNLVGSGLRDAMDPRLRI